MLDIKKRRTFHITIFTENFSWAGGMEFIRILVNALVQNDQEFECKVTLVFHERYLFHGLNEVIWTTLRAAKDIITKRHLEPKKSPNRQLLLDFMKNIEGDFRVESYNGHSGSLSSCLKRINPDVLFAPRNLVNQKYSIPWISYIPDFQHKYYPHFFSSVECLNRDINFATIIRDAPAIIVNSDSARQDIYKYFPYARSRIFTLPFAAAPVASWFTPSREDMSLKYGLPRKYFLICNQFWIHKSHITAFEALHDLLIRKGNKEYCNIVCTGKPDDYRCPEYYEELKQKIRSLGMKDRIFLLGFVPKADQIQIMKESIAVIQPTLFEGGPGGGSVYDAIALGVPAIISDIPVNREIHAEGVRFFPVGSFEALSGIMEAFAENPPRRREKEDLIKEGRMRTTHLRQTLLEAIHFVADGNTAGGK
ncbi:MAG: glycosyltransferase family 4 protein [Proteobacteria bacterium]|nr:glycosyltransferase family 4 protein [Pseudomonadota bacterium]